MARVPLRPAGERIGALVLVRDVTDLRRRDRELMTKDATIREIHHRVKNNLQTVAALLRLQARRLDEPRGKAALQEAALQHHADGTRLLLALALRIAAGMLARIGEAGPAAVPA